MKCTHLTANIPVTFIFLNLKPCLSQKGTIKDTIMQKLYFNVQTMNMAFNVFTMRKNHHFQ